MNHGEDWIDDESGFEKDSARNALDLVVSDKDLRRSHSWSFSINSTVAKFRSISTTSPKETRNFDTVVNTNSERRRPSNCP